MSIMYKPTEPLEVGIGESMPAEFIKEAERSRARIVSFTDEIKRLQAENAKLRELVDGLTWCCENYGCRQECPLYDVSEPDHCREVSIKRELGVEVTDG